VSLRRGDVVIVSLPGDYGKPRPAVVIQSDALSGFDSVILCPLTTAQTDTPLIRLTLEPNAENGLTARSEVMTEKVSTVSRRRTGRPIGRLSAAELAALDAKLVMVLGLV